FLGNLKPLLLGILQSLITLTKKVKNSLLLIQFDYFRNYKNEFSRLIKVNYLSIHSPQNKAS
ncbi:hypothetical protein, partial [Bacillus cereus]|uniref:hypothetical protein n=1 Tax=Bacillus cereus TaxID=1396 RepID=UPI001F3603A0